jgi:hypothetical protein
MRSRNLVSIAVLILLLAACGAERDAAELAALEAKAGRPAPASPASAPAAASPAASAPVIVRGVDGAEVLTMRIDGASVALSMTEAGQKHELRGEPRDSGKRKYTIDGAAVSYEVKSSDGGFKLRTADGKLRWKVKIAADKIKISDNEENNNPFELKVRDGDRVKVVAPGDRELGNVRFASAKTEVENAAGITQFRIEDPKPAGAFGVLLLDTIPATERAILLAEIFSRGR